AGHRVRADQPPCAIDHLGIVAVVASREHAGTTALQSIARKSRVFEGFIGHFEEQALLRIHLQRLSRSDAEEAGIETVHRIEEAAPARGDLAWCRRVGVE